LLIGSSIADFATREVVTSITKYFMSGWSLWAL